MMKLGRIKVAALLTLTQPQREGATVATQRRTRAEPSRARSDGRAAPNEGHADPHGPERGRPARRAGRRW